jgi:hypothetical protein
MSITATAPATIVLASTSERKVVQVMSDVWEEFSFFPTNELVDGKFVNKSVIANGQPQPVVNATEADKTIARLSLRKQGEEASMNALAWLLPISNPSGCFVTVVKGRKVAKGTRGIIKKAGTNTFGRWLLIRTSDGKETFVSADNCQTEFPLTQEQMEAIAKEVSKKFIEKAVNDLSLEPLSNIRWAVRNAVDEAAKTLAQGRLFFV